MKLSKFRVFSGPYVPAFGRTRRSSAFGHSPLNVNLNYFTAWKVSKYGFFLGPYFPVFGLNTVICGVKHEDTNQEKLRIRTFFTQCLLTLGFLQLMSNFNEIILVQLLWYQLHSKIFLWFLNLLMHMTAKLKTFTFSFGGFI